MNTMSDLPKIKVYDDDIYISEDFCWLIKETSKIMISAGELPYNVEKILCAFVFENMVSDFRKKQIVRKNGVDIVMDIYVRLKVNSIVKEIVNGFR